MLKRHCTRFIVLTWLPELAL